MVSQQEAHESVQVLLFICLPLLLLLITFIVVSVRGSRTIAKFPAFSVRIWPMGHGGQTLLHYKDYRETKKLVEFRVVPSLRWESRPPLRQHMLGWLKNARGEIVLIPPKELTHEEIQSLTPNLRLGLAKLGFDQYKICRECENQILAAGKTKEPQNAN